MPASTGGSPSANARMYTSAIGGIRMLHMIGHAIFGLIVGLVARAVLPGRQHMGLILTMILGIVGAWLGGLIGRATGMYKEGHPAGFLMALVGAVVVLLIYSFI
jgi:uncharacterized membrane protein YeaQ/YmgE (transglycosylase-associated protein family)